MSARIFHPSASRSASHVAAQTPMVSLLASNRPLQRKCACGGTPGPNGECESCRKKRLQRKGNGAGTQTRNTSAVPAIVHEVLRSPGQKLDVETRAFMEPHFGHNFGAVRLQMDRAPTSELTVIPSNDRSESEADKIARQVAYPPSIAAKNGAIYDFSSVRLHTDSKAARSARALNARAYTVGNDIVFADGQYSPGTSVGRELIAHELAHVAQTRENSSSQLRNALHRKTLETNESDCTATMHYLVQLLFKDEGAEKWNTGSKTRNLARKMAFRNQFKRSIEDTFNGNGFCIKPDAPSFESGLIFTEEKSCPCSDTGFKPKIQIDLVKDGEWSTAEDWEVDVAANPTDESIAADNWYGYGDLDEAGTTPVAKVSSAAGVTQVNAVHEFGHSIGLAHPGAGLGLYQTNTSPEYAHSGKDVKGRDVHGPTDLMGAGMGLRPFYFDPWRDELIEKYGDACGWQVIDPQAKAAKDNLIKKKYYQIADMGASHYVEAIQYLASAYDLYTSHAVFSYDATITGAYAVTDGRVGDEIVPVRIGPLCFSKSQDFGIIARVVAHELVHTKQKTVSLIRDHDEREFLAYYDTLTGTKMPEIRDMVTLKFYIEEATRCYNALPLAKKMSNALKKQKIDAIKIKHGF